MQIICAYKLQKKKKKKYRSRPLLQTLTAESKNKSPNSQVRPTSSLARKCPMFLRCLATWLPMMKSNKETEQLLWSIPRVKSDSKLAASSQSSLATTPCQTITDTFSPWIYDIVPIGNRKKGKRLFRVFNRVFQSSYLREFNRIVFWRRKVRAEAHKLLDELVLFSTVCGIDLWELDPEHFDDLLEYQNLNHSKWPCWHSWS